MVAQIANAFDVFFESLVFDRSILLQQSLQLITQSIIETIGNEGFNQLCELIPKLHNVFSHPGTRAERNNSMHQDDLIAELAAQANDAASSKKGSGRNRLLYLFQVLVESLCCGGLPLTIVLDDLHWADDIALEMLSHLVDMLRNSTDKSFHGGLLLLGSFRDNEVEKDGSLMRQIEIMGQGSANVIVLSIKDLSEKDISNMLSFKLCLPTRLTRPLAEIVHRKTRGNPYYVKQFLESIISNTLLQFSVKERRWIWDEDVIDLQMISDGVANLLTQKLERLSPNVLITLKVCCCLGFQVEESAIAMLNSDDFPFNLTEGLDSAVKEGLMEKAVSCGCRCFSSEYYSFSYVVRILCFLL